MESNRTQVAKARRITRYIMSVMTRVCNRGLRIEDYERLCCSDELGLPGFGLDSRVLARHGYDNTPRNLRMTGMTVADGMCGLPKDAAKPAMLAMAQL
jgi:hypothetical protein